MTHAIETFQASSNPFARMRNLYRTFRSERSRRIAVDRAYAELQTMSDQELIEFGLHRSDLIGLAQSLARLR